MGQSNGVSASAEVEDLPAGQEFGGYREPYREAYQAKAAPRLVSVEGISPSSGTRGARNKAEAAEENAQGVKLLNSAQYDEAVRRFKRALAFEPGSVQVLDNIGLAYAKRQDYNSAYEWYERAHTEDPEDVETLFSLAWVERKRQRYAHARELFTKVLEIAPSHSKALWLLGDILKNSQEFEGAIQKFETLVRMQPSSVDGHISLAQCFEATKSYSRAAQMYTHILENLSPGRVDIHFALGKAYFQGKQYRQALLQLDRVPDSDARGFEARSVAAKACRELEDHERAVTFAEAAAQIRPQAEVAHFLGEEYLRLGDQQRASVWFARSLELEPNHLPSLMELGQRAFRQSKWHDAEQHFTRVCELDRTEMEAVRWLGLVKYKLRKDDSCRQCCEALLRSDPLHSDALYLLAELNLQAGPADRWLTSLRLPREVSTADVCQSIAKGYLLRQQLSEASNWLSQALAYLPSTNPSSTALREAQQMLTRGSSVNPQDVIDILDRKPAPVKERWRTNDTATNPGEEDLERLLRRAERAGAGLASGSAEQQWREVLSSAKATLRRKPEDAVALRCAARALLSTDGEAGEIREYARQAMEYGNEAAGFTLGYELHAYLGKVAEGERNLSAAEKHYSAALSSKAGDETAMLGLARVLQRKEGKAQATKIYEQVVSSNPGSAEGHVRLAELALEADDAQEAYRLAAQAVKLSPDVAAQLCLGHASLKLGRADEASRALEQAAAMQPNALDVPSMIALASLYRKAGRDQDAILYYKRVLDVRPGDYECTLSLAHLHADRGPGGASQALHYYRSALQCRPTTVDARGIYMQMATVQCSISAWKDAQQTLEGAVRDLPEDAEMWMKLLGVCEQLKDNKGQHQCYRRLVQLKASTPASQTMYASLLLSEDRLREAKEQLTQAIKQEPTNATALLKLAQCCRQEGSREGNLEEARRYYEQVTQLNPSNLEALEGAAYCNRKANNLDQAIQLYQQCLKVNASAEGPLYYLGDILYRQHRHAECQFYLSRLVDTNCAVDYKTGALYLLAKSHVSLDEYEEAEKQARCGLALKPNHPHFLFILALVKNRMADYDSSIATLKRAFQHLGAADSDNLKVEIHDWLAQAYERKGEYTNASAELALALKQDPLHVSSLITQGLIHMQLSQTKEPKPKELDQAEAFFRRALAIEKNHALALLRLGYCKLICNDLQEAILLFQRALQQRCGTVALARSVKGSARIYMALALMGKQDMDGALYQLAEARKSHRNFESLCASAKDSIVKGECEGLVGKLRSVPDLDVTVAQAWQLVELMAKELEMGLRDPAQGKLGGYATGSPERKNGEPSAADGQAERRAWVAAPPAPERRQWTTPEVKAETKAAGKPKEEGKLMLDKHEIIDFNQLTQKDCLGSGGFGAVYRGYLGAREVAIKKLFCEDGGNISPLQLEELEKEVAALRSLSHPRLVAFIGACLQPPNLCIVTEFMAGGSLHHLLHKARTPLTLSTQSKMALQVCEGVDFLHGHQPPVVHRDLKSLNIVLDRIYNAKICDFGLTQSMEKTHITLKEGGNGGSPRYMAPECYDCKGKITEKVDTWALGFFSHEMAAFSWSALAGLCLMMTARTSSKSSPRCLLTSSCPTSPIICLQAFVPSWKSAFTLTASRGQQPRMFTCGCGGLGCHQDSDLSREMPTCS
ncbi:unnamed protein product [Effrenium voratum]|uniref:Protein kinase domain-containing protein n=1 Tax=Effrenium voratum TaxID=2562239 RepID=A0AA36NFG5_9DINO|nr:unnamed protein product [Effrenium voratum]